MEKDKKEKTLQEELRESFSEDYIYQVGTLLHEMAEKFYEEKKLAGKVYFNDVIFESCLIDILVDLGRLRHFHDINLVNEIKLMAYSASWLLKRKPFQLIEGCEAEYQYVNEKFALSLLFHAVGMFDKNVKIMDKDKENLVSNISSMFYHLKYRNTNPQTLEFMLMGIENGKMWQIVTE